MVFGYFRQVLYISLLFTNAIAILNEERFLAKSEHPYTSYRIAIGTHRQVKRD